MDNTRVLTDRGYLFHDEIKAMVDAGEKVTFACYDKATSEMVYRDGELIEPDGDEHELVDFTSPSEKQNWQIGSDAYGATKAQAGDHLSLQVTSGHDMYAASVGSNGVWSEASKLKAQDMVNATDDEETEVQYRFVDGAANGRQSSPAQVAELETLLSDNLDLHTAVQRSAFLELYGLWLANGSIDASALRLTQNTEDSMVLLGALSRCGLTEGSDYSLTRDERDCVTVHISNRKWMAYFTSSTSSGQSSAVESEMAGVKSFGAWVRRCCTRDQLRLIIRGLSVSRCEKTADQCIETSSVQFRDEVQAVLTDAGYTSFFEADATSAITNWRILFGAASNNGPKLSSSDAVPTKYMGKVWCVNVDHPDHLIIAQRAERNMDSFVINGVKHQRMSVTKASRPVVVGQCKRRYNIKLWKTFTDCFNCLPIAAIVDEKICQSQ